MKKKYIILIFILFIGICTFLFISIYDKAKQESIKNLNFEQMLYATQASKSIEDFFSNWTTILKILSETSHIKDMDITGKENMDNLYKNNSELFRAVTRVNANGRIIYTIPFDRNAIGRDISDQKHIREIMDTHKPVISDVFFAVQGYSTIAIHVPVFNGKTYNGTIAIGINFQTLAKRYVENIKIGETGYAWIISRDGTELYCPVPGHMGNSVFKTCKDFPSILAMAEDMLKGHKGTTQYYYNMIRGDTTDVVKKHAIYMPISIGNTFWTIIVATSEDEVISSLKYFRNRLMAIVAILLFGGVLFAYYGLKSMVIIREEEKRRRAEEALRANRKQLIDVINFLPDATLAIDKEKRIIIWNKAMEKMTGIPVGEMIGKGDDLYTIPFYGEARKSLLDLVFENSRETEHMYPVFTREGDAIMAELFCNALYGNRGAWIFAKASPLYDESGNIIGAIESMRDVTVQKLAEEEKQNLEERIARAEKMEALGTLAGGIAHDLNNVLGIVVGYAELLLFEIEKSDPIRAQMESIYNGGRKAAAMIEDMLTMARRGVQTRQIVNLNNIIIENLKSPEFMRLSRQFSSVHTEENFDPELLNISASPVHLSKTFFNLILNAFEAMPNGGLLTISTYNKYLDKPVKGYDEVKGGDYVVLSISDTGTGISSDDLKRIFEPFYTKKIMGRSGTGLGLAVVWSTVKDHNGYIDVQSEEGKGSVFMLFFPASREEISSEKTSVLIAEYSGKGESILVVDDVTGQRDLAAGMLKKLNYKVATVSSGEEALAYLKENTADLIVLDMIMDPGMDGLDTYKKILEIRPGQKAIIVSGFSETSRVEEAQSLGAGAYVKKPYLIERLGLAIKKELEQF